MISYLLVSHIVAQVVVISLYLFLYSYFCLDLMISYLPLTHIVDQVIIINYDEVISSLPIFISFSIISIVAISNISIITNVIIL